MVSYLSEELIKQIGKEMRLPMLIHESMIDDSDPAITDYFEYFINEYNGIPLLIVRRGGLQAYRSVYTLNLNTLKPTNNSPLKRQLSSRLCNKIKNENPAYGGQYGLLDKHSRPITDYFKSV